MKNAKSQDVDVENMHTTVEFNIFICIEEASTFEAKSERWNVLLVAIIGSQ
jgi:hypothetical protein